MSQTIHGLYTDFLPSLSKICTQAVEFSTKIVKFSGSSKAMLSSTTRSVKLVQADVLGGATLMVVLRVKSASGKWEKEHSYIKYVSCFVVSNHEPQEDLCKWQ